MTGVDALRSDAAWIDLSNRTEIEVTGEDRARLLHAMSTNDVKNLAPLIGLYAFFLNSQGRILSDAYIWNLGDRVVLDSEPELRQTLFAHLDKYIIADDATLRDLNDEWTVIGLEGPKSLERAEESDIPVPPNKFSLLPFHDGFVARIASTGPTGLRLFLPKSDSLLLPIPQASSEEARLVRLENGVPRYSEEVSERYLVQETGLLDAVHPNKGCYLGQEIVERVRSRAQVHRHLKHFAMAAQKAPAAGTKLKTADGKEAAEIASALYSPALEKVVGFAYVRTEALNGGLPEVELS